MNAKTDALWTMARRFKEAAETEKDLAEAEKLTAKAVQYWEAWQEAVAWLDLC